MIYEIYILFFKASLTIRHTATVSQKKSGTSKKIQWDFQISRVGSLDFLDLKVNGSPEVCYGNVFSMRHIYGKSFDNTRQLIFLKTNARKSRSQWSLNCICTDSVTPRCVHISNLGFLGCMLMDTIFLDLMAVVKVRDAP